MWSTLDYSNNLGIYITRLQLFVFVVHIGFIEDFCHEIYILGRVGAGFSGFFGIVYYMKYEDKLDYSIVKTLILVSIVRM